METCLLCQFPTDITVVDSLNTPSETDMNNIMAQ